MARFRNHSMHKPAGPSGLAAFVLAAILAIGLPAASLPGSAGHEGAPAGAVGLDVSAEGDVVDVLLAYHRDGQYELHHLRSVDGGKSWGGEVSIPTGDRPPKGPHRGMDAQIAAHGDHVVVAWTIPGSSAFGTGPLATARSDDGGETWTAAPSPADDGSDDGHGFADLTFAPDGKLHAVWLDARDGSQGLRWARSDDFGNTWGVNQTIDPVTCECCWNKIVAEADGEAYVLYRDKDPRDMALAASSDSGDSWRECGPTEPFEWEVDGCPHVGGGLATTDGPEGETVHVVSWTGQKSVAGLYIERSGDRGQTWQPPQALAGPSAQHADLAARQGSLAAAWDVVENGKRKVVASLSADAHDWSPPTQLSSSGVNASHPLVVAVSDGFLVAWTEMPEGGPSTWKSVRLGTR